MPGDEVELVRKVTAPRRIFVEAGAQSTFDGRNASFQIDDSFGERIVVSRFPDADAAKAYIASPQYQAAKALRMGAATVVMRLLVD